MDTRTLITGGLAAIALVGAIVLFGLGLPEGAAYIGSLAATLVAYVVGLNSEPVTRPAE